MSNPEELPLAQNFARGLDVYTRLQSTAVDEVRPAFQPTHPVSPEVPSPMFTLGLVVPSRRPPTDHRTVTHVPKQDEISDGAASMRQAVIQADRAGVLSANETVEDIATSDLKYVMCNFYLASIVARTRTPDPAARAPIATEASDALEAFLTMCETHELLTEQAGAVRERQKQGDTPDPATARADKVAGFKRERAIRARLEELDAERRRRAEEALLNADWDDEDPDASPEDEESDRERWLLVIEDSIGKALDDVPMDSIDLVVTLCAEEQCPVFPAEVKRLAWPLPDPGGTPGLDGYRSARDEIRRRLPGLWT